MYEGHVLKEAFTGIELRRSTYTKEEGRPKGCFGGEIYRSRGVHFPSSDFREQYY